MMVSLKIKLLPPLQESTSKIVISQIILILTNFIQKSTSIYDNKKYTSLEIYFILYLILKKLY